MKELTINAMGKIISIHDLLVFFANVIMSGIWGFFFGSIIIYAVMNSKLSVVDEMRENLAKFLQKKIFALIALYIYYEIIFEVFKIKLLFLQIGYYFVSIALIITIILYIPLRIFYLIDKKRKEKKIKLKLKTQQNA